MYALEGATDARFVVALGKAIDTRLLCTLGGDTDTSLVFAFVGVVIHILCLP